MNPTIPARVQARSHADRRLQSMTVGAVALGFLATGGFAYAAALTYSGTTSTPTLINQQAAGVGQPQTVPNGNSGFSGQSNTQGGNVNPYFGNQQVVPPTTSRHHGFVTSGGS